jgi:poly(hydroxyalkanoate) granule-associated protein
MASRHTRNDRPRAGKRRAPMDEASGRDRRREAQAQLLQGVQQVWLAGMGAIARAQKDGPAAFTDAVSEGLKLLGQSRSNAQRIVRDAFDAAQETLQTRVGGVRDQAQETWDNLETLFQNRVQRAMHDLGVPTAREIRDLTRRVTDLNESVQRINARERVRATSTGSTASNRRARPAKSSKTSGRPRGKTRATTRRPRKSAATGQE